MNLSKIIEKAQRTITVRPMQEKDIPMILQWESQEPFVGNWNLEQYLKALHDPNIISDVIIEKKFNIPIGYSILKKNSPDEQTVEWTRLVIANEFKNRGYGTLYIVQYIWDRMFNEPNVMRIWHDVFEDNKIAIRLYEKLGYKLFNRTIDPISGKPLLLYELSKQAYFASAC